MSNTILEEIFNFTADDLAANKRGEITQRQRNKLRRDNACAAATLLGMALLAVSLFVLSALEGNTGQMALFVGFMLMVAGIGWFARKDFARVNATEVTSISGSASVSQSSTYDSTNNRRTYYSTMTVGNQSFRVNNKVYFKLPQLQNYTVYYIPEHNVVLSVEVARTVPATKSGYVPSDPAVAAAVPAAKSSSPPIPRYFDTDTSPEKAEVERLVQNMLNGQGPPIHSSNDPAEDYARGAEYAEQARQRILAGWEYAMPLLAENLDNMSTRILLRKIGAKGVPAIMTTITAETPSWEAHKIGKHLSNLPHSSDFYDALEPYAAVGQPSPRRRAAIYALGWIDDPRRLPLLLNAVQDTDPDAYLPAMEALGRLGEGMDLVAAYVGSMDNVTNATALAALWEAGDPRGYQRAFNLAASKFEGPRTQAAEMLATIITTPWAQDALAKLATDETTAVQQAARDALQNLKQEHGERSVRKWASTVLKQTG